MTRNVNNLAKKWLEGETERISVGFSLTFTGFFILNFSPRITKLTQSYYCDVLRRRREKKSIRMNMNFGTMTVLALQHPQIFKFDQRGGPASFGQSTESFLVIFRGVGLTFAILLC